MIHLIYKRKSCTTYEHSAQARRHAIKSGPAVLRASVEGWSGGEHERVVTPSRKGGSGVSPKNCFNLWLPLCVFFNAFWMRFGTEFQWFWLRSFERIIYEDMQR